MASWIKHASIALAASWLTTPLVAPVHAVNAVTETPKPAGVWLLWVITVAIFGAITAITFKNAKRSHQD